MKGDRCLPATSCTLNDQYFILIIPDDLILFSLNGGDDRLHLLFGLLGQHVL